MLTSCVRVVATERNWFPLHPPPLLTNEDVMFDTLKIVVPIYLTDDTLLRSDIYLNAANCHWVI